jgi:hypothetical protein
MFPGSTNIGLAHTRDASLRATRLLPAPTPGAGAGVDAATGKGPRSLMDRCEVGRLEGEVSS